MSSYHSKERKKLFKEVLRHAESVSPVSKFLRQQKAQNIDAAVDGTFKSLGKAANSMDDKDKRIEELEFALNQVLDHTSACTNMGDPNMNCDEIGERLEDYCPHCYAIYVLDEEESYEG